MTDSDGLSAEELEKSPFAQMVRQSLALERLMASGELVTAADLEHDDPLETDFQELDPEDLARITAIARLASEADRRRAVPPGTA